ncbi:MAG: preprotein translocase subunit SecA [Holosporales bacterium]|jgi:preprotein translocase subunit SecA|nr:preprotein translocase subunit SecA [Holosporales bacterium]
MFLQAIQRMFGSRNDRIVKGFRKQVEQINALEPSMQALSDADLCGKTAEFRERLAQGESLDFLLPEAFAVVREASQRALGMRPFDVQLIGGMVLHQGKIAEMKTGEGKTLVATLPVYLNALTEKGVHVVTVNDYLAHRDAQWMGKIYEFLGMSVGIIVHGLTDTQRQEAYASDITYGTNNEFGFDYLRDNMKFYGEELVQRPFNYAIVDEVDSILIDEARTPLIISGPAEDSTELYLRVNEVIPKLDPECYEKDEKHRQVTLTEAGNERIEQLLKTSDLLKQGSLYDVHNIGLVHHVNQALKAHQLFKLDVDYIVKDGELILIDEFTGRMMEGRRFSEGLHQALEAKEGVKVQMENQTLATITFQNFFRMYPKLAGMTGTAATEAAELMDIYKLDTIVIPTNVAVNRQDHDDEVYRTEVEKNAAIVTLIRECQLRQQPVLVGTVSIEKSEQLSGYLKKEKISHQVLNARYHDIEAQIIAEAGSPGAVTIATNMAGRGTDIKLGGNLETRLAKALMGVEDLELRAQKEAEVVEQLRKDEEATRAAGGLYVVGTERHESRRIDNQLRGRSGRQGDAGASKFFLSLEDDLMRIFGSDRLDKMLQKLGLQEGEAIVHPWVNKAIEKAQSRVEARNYDIRKHLLRYDDVMNDQRKVVYTQRHELMHPEIDLKEEFEDMRAEAVTRVTQEALSGTTAVGEWDVEKLHADCQHLFALDLPLETWVHEEGCSEPLLRERILGALNDRMEKKETLYGSEMMRHMERTLLLRLMDQHWKDHLLILDRLRKGINLRAYAQKDPLNEYKNEAFALFENMMNLLREEAVHVLSRFEIESALTAEDLDETLLPHAVVAPEEELPPETTRMLPKEGVLSPTRNAPCPCGSGKKYKHCHGKVK